MDVLTQFFHLLPANAEIRINIENRIPCTLKIEAGKPVLAPKDSSSAEIEISVFPELIRKLNTDKPTHLAGLFKVFSELYFAGHVRYKLLVSFGDLYAKGYFHALKNIGPEIQKEFSMHAFTAFLKANELVAQAKSFFAKK